MIKKLFNTGHLLLMAFFAGLTIAALGQWLQMPGKGYQVAGTLMMFVASLIWTYSTPKERRSRNADR